MNHLFEKATRQRWRFETVRGWVGVEDLWDIPLALHRDNLDLDTIAKKINQAIKEFTEESFVNVTNNPSKVEAELKLELVKYIISVKQAENTARLDAASKAEKKHKLIEILSRKQDAALENLTPEEIQAQIEALSK